MTFVAPYSGKFGTTYLHRGDTINVFTQPTFGCEYIKQLAIVEHNPNISKKDTLNICYSNVPRNFDIFRSLEDFGCIKQTGTGRYKTRLFSITPTGMKLLNEARRSKHVFDLIDFIHLTNCESIQEFELLTAIHGMSHMFESDYVNKIIDACESFPFLKNKLKKSVVFIEEYLKLATDSH